MRGFGNTYDEPKSHRKWTTNPTAVAQCYIVIGGAYNTTHPRRSKPHGSVATFAWLVQALWGVQWPGRCWDGVYATSPLWTTPMLRFPTQFASPCTSLKTACKAELQKQRLQPRSCSKSFLALLVRAFPSPYPCQATPSPHPRLNR